MQKIIRNPLVFTGILFIMFSCSTIETESTCNVSDPLRDLGWLKDRINLITSGNPSYAKYYYVSLAEYEGNDVFIFGNCDPVANAVFPVFNCEGQHLGNVGEIPIDNLINRRTIWKTSNSECTF